jgi:uncharacterized protein
MTETIFRPFQPSEALRSDRSARDRTRHRELVRESIKENITDIISEESIIGQDKNKIIRIPIRGIREYQFVYGDNEKGVSQGDGNAQPGQVVGKKPSQGEGEGKGKAGDQPGVDYYETDITLAEVLQMLFENLELPNEAQKKLKQIKAEVLRKKHGYKRKGITAHFDKKKTARERVKRKAASMRHIPREEKEDGRPEE